MRVRLSYGYSGLWISLPDEWKAQVVEPRFVPGLTDPGRAITEALRNPIGTAPLRELAKPSDRVGVVFSDITRPTPNQLILPRVLEEVAYLPKGHVTLFNALGTHRPNTVNEMRSMLGAGKGTVYNSIVSEYRIVQNNAFDPTTQVFVGRSSYGHEIWLNQELMACDVIVLTGFIEPHFFAGFSGGGKAVMPGMAGQRSVLGNHDAAMIGNPKATWGITRGNPIWEEIREVSRCAGTTFLLNVTLNRDKEITGVFSGDLDQAHDAGCVIAKATAMVSVPRRFDIVVSTNSGYPLDQNLYQSVKGMSVAAQVVRDGGAIIIATECRNGVPDHGLYGQLLREAGSPQAVLDSVRSPGFLRQDQWQVQIQAQIQLKADVYAYSSSLTDEQIQAALLQPCRSVEQTIARLRDGYGPGATLCVLPEGPQTIPYVE